MSDVEEDCDVDRDGEYDFDFLEEVPEVSPPETSAEEILASTAPHHFHRHFLALLPPDDDAPLFVWRSIYRHANALHSATAVVIEGLRGGTRAADRTLRRTLERQYEEQIILLNALFTWIEADAFQLALSWPPTEEELEILARMKEEACSTKGELFSNKRSRN